MKSSFLVFVFCFLFCFYCACTPLKKEKDDKNFIVVEDIITNMESSEFEAEETEILLEEGGVDVVAEVEEKTEEIPEVVAGGIIATKTLTVYLSEFGDNVVVEGDEAELAIFKKAHFWTESAKYENGYYLIVSAGPSKVSTGRREFQIPADVYYEFFNLYADDTEDTVLLVDAATKTPALFGKGVNYYCDKNGCCLLVDLW